MWVATTYIFDNHLLQVPSEELLNNEGLVISVNHVDSSRTPYKGDFMFSLEIDAGLLFIIIGIIWIMWDGKHDKKKK